MATALQGTPTVQPFNWFLYVSFALVVSIASTGNCSADEAAAIRHVRDLGGRVTRQNGPAEGPVIGVDLAASAVNGTQLAELHSLKNLRNLSLRGTIKWTANGPDLIPVPILSDDLRYLHHFPDLRSLDLGYTLVDGTGLAHLSQAANLETLHLDGLSMQGNSLDALRGCSKLRELSLTVAPGLDLQPLKDLPRLQTLRITGPEFDFKLDAALKSQLILLKDFTSLQTLDIGVCDDVLHALHESHILHKQVRASGINGRRPARAEEVINFDLRRLPYPVDDPL